jgi:hypothetical protein
MGHCIVSRFYLSKSFNYAPYLSPKKVEKRLYLEITSLLDVGSGDVPNLYLYLILITHLIVKLQLYVLQMKTCYRVQYYKYVLT